MRARGRMLAWRISEGRRVNALSGPWPMLLYTWLIAHADNLGRFHGEPEQVKALVFPRRRDVTADHIEEWLDELVRTALILRWNAGGMRYVQFPEQDWNSHQRLSGNMRKTSDLPPCPNAVRTEYERRLNAVRPEVEVEGEVEVEVEGEMEREVEVEGEGESREEGAKATPQPVSGTSTPVAIATGTSTSKTRGGRQELVRGQRVRLPSWGLSGVVDGLDAGGVTVRTDVPLPPPSEGNLVYVSHGQVEAM